MERRIIIATAVSVALVTTSATAAVMAAIRPAEAPSVQTVAVDQPVPNGPTDAGAFASSAPEPVEVETIYVDEFITVPAPAPAPAQTLTAAATHDAFDDNGGDQDRDDRVEAGDDRDDDGFDDEFEDDDHEDDEDDEFEDEDEHEFEDDESDDD